jgi:hypothetical protein
MKGPPIADIGLAFRSNGMDSLCVLLHNPPDTGKVKVIGIYSSEALAEAAMERARILPGFVDQPDCFTIERYEIDDDHWPRGFIRL